MALRSVPIFQAVVLFLASLFNFAVGGAAGPLHTCLLTSSGRVFCWGSGGQGQLGRGDDQNEGLADVASNISTGERACDLAIGPKTSCAALTDGTVKCWGQTPYIQAYFRTRYGESPSRSGDLIPRINLGVTDGVRQVVIGDRHACALTFDNTVKCWGQGGHLGMEDWDGRGPDDPSTMGNKLPFVHLGTGSVPTKLAAGNHHTCALLIGGTVKCWGLAVHGALANGAANNIGDELSEDLTWGPTVQLGLGEQPVKIAAGYAHTCVVLEGPVLKCFGYNFDSELGYNDANLRGLLPEWLGDLLPGIDLGPDVQEFHSVSIARHSCITYSDFALPSNKRAKCWGDNAGGQLGIGTTTRQGYPLPQHIEVGSHSSGHEFMVDQVVAADKHTCALLSLNNETSYDSAGVTVGTKWVKCWGLNSVGQLGLEDTTPRGDSAGKMGDYIPTVSLSSTSDYAIELAAGKSHTCAVFNSKKMKCWGSNTNGQLGLGDTIHRGTDANQMGASLPYLTLSPSDSLDVIAMCVGYTHSCAILADAGNEKGKLKCWGENANGQLGYGDQVDRSDPSSEDYVDLGGYLVSHVACGDMFTCVSNSSMMQCMGLNDKGQLGLGHTADVITPTLVPLDLLETDAICEVSAFNDFVCVLVDKISSCVNFTETYAQCWGAGDYGQLGALSVGGAVGDDSGEMGDALATVALAGEVQTLQAGAFHTCAIVNVGGKNELHCWGLNADGQLGLGNAAPAADPGVGELPQKLTLGNCADGAECRPSTMSLGGHHTCAVMQTGEVMCWGDNQGGYLGLGTTVTPQPSPGRVQLGSDVLALEVVVGRYHSCILTNTSEVKCWGHNNAQQLGYGDLDNRGGSSTMGDKLPDIHVALESGETVVALANSVTRPDAQTTSSSTSSSTTTRTSHVPTTSTSTSPSTFSGVQHRTITSSTSTSTSTSTSSSSSTFASSTTSLSSSTSTSISSSTTSVATNSSRSTSTATTLSRSSLSTSTSLRSSSTSTSSSTMTTSSTSSTTSPTGTSTSTSTTTTSSSSSSVTASSSSSSSSTLTSSFTSSSSTSTLSSSTSTTRSTTTYTSTSSSTTSSTSASSRSTSTATTFTRSSLPSSSSSSTTTASLPTTSSLSTLSLSTSTSSSTLSARSSSTSTSSSTMTTSSSLSPTAITSISSTTTSTSTTTSSSTMVTSTSSSTLSSSSLTTSSALSNSSTSSVAASSSSSSSTVSSKSSSSSSSTSRSRSSSTSTGGDSTRSSKTTSTSTSGAAIATTSSSTSTTSTTSSSSSLSAPSTSTLSSVSTLSSRVSTATSRTVSTSSVSSSSASLSSSTSRTSVTSTTSSRSASTTTSTSTLTAPPAVAPAPTTIGEVSFTIGAQVETCNISSLEAGFQAVCASELGLPPEYATATAVCDSNATITRRRLTQEEVDMIDVSVDILIEIPLDASPDIPAYNVSAIADIVGDPEANPDDWDNSVARVIYLNAVAIAETLTPVSWESALKKANEEGGWLSGSIAVSSVSEFASKRHTTSTSTSSTASASSTTSSRSSGSTPYSLTSTTSTKSSSSTVTTNTRTTITTTTSSTSSTSSSTTSTSTTTSTTSTSSSTSSSSSSSSAISITTSTTTSTTATWGAVLGSFTFDANGLSTRQVREACRTALSQTLDFESSEYVTCRIAAPAARRRLLAGVDSSSGSKSRTVLEEEKDLGARRHLTASSPWDADFILYVPAFLDPAVRAAVSALRSDHTAFEPNLFEALQQDADNVTAVRETFVMGGFGSSPPFDPLTAMIAKLERAEAALVDNLFVSNASRLEVVIGGVIVVAEKIDTAYALTSSEPVEVKPNENMTVALQSSTFTRLGVQEGEDVIVTLAPIVPTTSSSSDDSGADGAEDTMLTSILMNIFAADGGVYSVSGLTEPILLTMPIPPGSAGDGELLCAFWDDATASWSTSGLSFVARTDSELICATTHLSLFGAIVRGFAGAIVCAQASLLSEKGLRKLTQGDWYLQLGAVIMWSAVLLTLICLGVAIYLDLQRSRVNEWGDTCFLIPDADGPIEEEELNDMQEEANNRDRLLAAVGICWQAFSFLELILAVIAEMMTGLCADVFAELASARESLDVVIAAVLDACSSRAAFKTMFYSAVVLTTRRVITLVSHRTACVDIGVSIEDEHGEAMEEAKRIKAEASSELS